MALDQKLHTWHLAKSKTVLDWRLAQAATMVEVHTRLIAARKRIDAYRKTTEAAFRRGAVRHDQLLNAELAIGCSWKLHFDLTVRFVSLLQSAFGGLEAYAAERPTAFPEFLECLRQRTEGAQRR